MIRLGLFFVAVFALAAGVAWMADQPGLVEINWFGYEYSRHPTVLLLHLASLFLVLGAVIFLLTKVASVPAVWRRFRHRRRTEKGYSALTQGLVAAAAGDAREATRHAKKADALLTNPPMTLLLRAQAATLDGDAVTAERYYREMASRPETEFLGLRGLFVAAQRRGDTGTALQLAKRAFAIKPKAPWVLNALFEMETVRGSWDDALAALDAALKARLIDGKVARRRRAVLLTQKAQELEAGGDAEGALQAALKAHDLVPGLEPAAMQAARLLVAKGRQWRAAEVIEATWADAPHPDLARAYAAVREAEGPKAVAKWLKGLAGFKPDHFESRILKARQHIVLGEWAEARGQLEPLLESRPTARVCALMAEVERGERPGDPDAERAGRLWVERAVRAPRDTTWVCARCGNESFDWSVLCGNCGAFDSLTWKLPHIETLARLDMAAGQVALPTYAAPVVVPAAPVAPAAPAAPESPAVPDAMAVPPAAPAAPGAPVAPVAPAVLDTSTAEAFHHGVTDVTPEVAPSGPKGPARATSVAAPPAAVAPAPMAAAPQPGPSTPPTIEYFVPPRPPDDPGPPPDVAPHGKARAPERQRL